MMLSKVCSRIQATGIAAQRARMTRLTLLMPQRVSMFSPMTKYKFDDEDWEPDQFQVRT